MNLNRSIALLPLAAACALFGASAQAQSTVTFQGTVASVSCTATVTTGGGTVTLPLIMADALPNNNSTAGATTFTVAVTGCGNNPGVTAKIYFYNATANAVSGGRLNTNPARGWQFQLLPATGNAQLPVGQNATVVPFAGDPGGSIATGATNINYRVRYFRNGNLTPGNASATANFVLYYV